MTVAGCPLTLKDLRTTLVIAALSTLGPFSIDTYFPSFPALAAHFRVTELELQSTLSVYLVALAGMNLFHGALSDSFGRQRVLLVALGIYSASAFACVVAPSFGWLLGLRVAQGLAGGAGMIVSRAVIRDLFQGAEAQRLMAQVAMLTGLGPAVAPIVGGWLQVWFGWRGPFVFLGAMGLGLWGACRYVLSESLPCHARQPFHPGRLFRAYVETSRHPAFILSCLSLACGGGGFLLYVATAPDVALNILHLRATQFGWLFIPIVSGLMAGSAVCSRVAGHIPPERLARHGFVLMSLGAALNVAVNLARDPRIPWAVLPLTVYTFGFSLVAPVVTLAGLDLFPRRRGLAASLQGFIHILVFALISGAVAPLVHGSGLRHAWGQGLLMVLSWVSYRGYRMLAPNRETNAA